MTNDVWSEQSHATAAATSSGRPAGIAGDRRPDAAVVRVARMEQWLTTRTAHDPSASAQPAADLGLWVLEHLEH